MYLFGNYVKAFLYGLRVCVGQTTLKCHLDLAFKADLSISILSTKLKGARLWECQTRSKKESKFYYKDGPTFNFEAS